MNNEATDEVWYKRAVEYHYNNPNSFVFSVPFDIGDKRPTTVTATHAIYKEQNGRKAPAAVVGVQIDYDKFAQNFMDVTTGSGGAGYKVPKLLNTKTTLKPLDAIPARKPSWQISIIIIHSI